MYISDYGKKFDLYSKEWGNVGLSEVFGRNAQNHYLENLISGKMVSSYI